MPYMFAGGVTGPLLKQQSPGPISAFRLPHGRSTTTRVSAINTCDSRQALQRMERIPQPTDMAWTSCLLLALATTDDACTGALTASSSSCYRHMHAACLLHGILLVHGFLSDRGKQDQPSGQGVPSPSAASTAAAASWLLSCTLPLHPVHVRSC